MTKRFGNFLPVIITNHLRYPQYKFLNSTFREHISKNCYEFVGYGSTNYNTLCNTYIKNFSRPQLNRAYRSALQERNRSVVR